MESTNLAEFPEEVNRLLAERATLRKNEQRAHQVVQQYADFGEKLGRFAGTGALKLLPALTIDLPPEALQYTIAIRREVDAIDTLSSEIGERRARVESLQKQIDRARAIRMAVITLVIFVAFVIAVMLYQGLAAR